MYTFSHSLYPGVLKTNHNYHSINQSIDLSFSLSHMRTHKHTHTHTHTYTHTLQYNLLPVSPAGHTYAMDPLKISPLALYASMQTTGNVV